MGRVKKLSEKQIKQLKSVINDSLSSGREVKRCQAILMLNRNTGIDMEDITDMTGFGRSQIFELRKKYAEQGIESIRDKRKGKPKELLKRKQRQEIIKTLTSKTPSGCDPYYNSDYWTTGVLAEYIKRAYKVEYKSKTSHYIIFRQAKFTYHKPGRVYERRNEQEVEVWRNKAKERAQSGWHDSNTVVLAEDEMHLSTQTTVQKIWLPQGEYPNIEVTSKREARSVYGFLNIKTGQEHAFKMKWQNMYITAEILKKIRKTYPWQKILLLWDQAGWHKGREAQKVIKEDGNIETFYFPAAAPEENPQEHVWKNGRSEITHNVFIKDIDKTADQFVAAWV